MQMLKLGSTAAIAAILSAAVSISPALARGGGHEGHGGGGFHHGFHDHDGFRGGFFFGGIGGLYYPYWDYPYYGYPYAYAYAYPYPYPYAAPYAPAAAPAAPPNDVWYFCQPAKAYYPYVSTCPVPWQQVPAQPR
jgi:hypothetical protein